MPPNLNRVIRLDSIPLPEAYFTSEGYLIDRPILTSTGIFEYINPDGSVRYELRLPEEVFAEESLASYQGKPVIITHEAEYVTKDNVQSEAIGTILSKGYQDGSDVRAQIIIHDTDAMKECGLRELSLGYDLDLEETPGEWNGQHYDAIQRNIRINHLALVREARAGDQARLHIDSRDNKSILKGGKAMKKKPTKQTQSNRKDGILTPDELKQAIAEYKKRREARRAEKADEGEKPEEKPVISTKPEIPNTDNDEVGNGEEAVAAKPVVPAADEVPDPDADVEEKVDFVKDRRDRRDEQGDPKTLEEANGVIAHQDEDIDSLFDIIDTLLAEREFNASKSNDGDEPKETPTPVNPAKPVSPASGTETDEEDFIEKPTVGEDGDDTCNGDEDEETVKPNVTVPAKSTNTDSVDNIVRQRVKVGTIGNMLGLDGLEDMSIIKAKKTIIRAVRPGVRLDGKSKSYIDAMFDCAADEVKRKSAKDTNYQKRQMFNADGYSSKRDDNSSMSARQRMIARQHNSKKEDK